MTDAANAPVSGGKLRIYNANTTTLTNVYSDGALTVPLINPVVAGSDGVCPQVFAAEGVVVDMQTETAAGVVLRTYEDVTFVGVTSNTLSRDFATSRFQVYGAGGVVEIEVGDPSPDNVGGKGRLGGWAGTQADTFTLDSAALIATGSFSVSGPLKLSDGSVVVNSSAPVVGSGRWYVPDTYAASGITSATITHDRIYWLPFSKALSVDAMVFNLWSAVVGNIQVGLYTSNPTTGLPGTLVEGSAAISSNTTGNIVSVFAASHAVTTRMWLGLLASADAGVTSTTAVSCDPRVFGTAAGVFVQGAYSNFAYAALPATAPAITAFVASGLPLLYARAL